MTLSLIDQLFSDIYSKSAEELDAWEEEFSWPYTWHEFLQLENDIVRVFYKVIETVDNPLLKTLLTINFKDYISVLNNFYMQGLYEKLNVPDSDRDIQIGLIIPDPHARKKQPLLGWLRNAYARYRIHPATLIWSDKKHLITDTSFSGQTISYIRNRGIYPQYQSLLNSDIPIKDLNVDPVLELLKVYLSEITMRMGISGKVLDNCVGYIESRLKQTYNIYTALLAKVDEGVSLYLGPNNNTYSRALSAAIQNKGGTVYGFTHGEPIVYNWYKVSWMELALTNIYYEYSEGLADLLTKTVEKYPPPIRHPFKIRHQTNSQYKAISDRRISLSPGHKVRTIMVIGNAYRHDSYSCVTAPPSPVQFHLERRILRKLLDAGFEVIYQQHPGGAMGGELLDFKLEGPLRVNRNLFKQSLEEPDAFLFYYTRTTTFGPAVCTQKPIILIDGGWEDIVEKQSESLGKRCTYINGKYDINNRLSFNIEYILQVDNERLKAVNTEFMDAYLV